MISVEPQQSILSDSPSLSSALDWSAAHSLLTVVVRKLLLTQQIFFAERALNRRSAAFIPGCTHGNHNAGVQGEKDWGHSRGVIWLYGYRSTVWSREGGCIRRSSLERQSICSLLLSHQCALRDGIWIKKGEYVVPAAVILVKRFLGDTQVLGTDRGGSTRSKLSEGLEERGWDGWEGTQRESGGHDQG